VNADANESDPDPTSWPLVLNAAAGQPDDREAFARKYSKPVRAYLSRRWQSSRLRSDIDDAVQEVFVECFREGGVLDRLREKRPESFRRFLRGVVRNVALRYETRVGLRLERVPPSSVNVGTVPSDELTASRVLDRSWARALLRQAARLQQDRAVEKGERAVERIALLRLRHVDGLPIREIAERWSADAAHLHKEYARAREEFRAALTDVVRFYFPERSAHEVDESCRDLLGLLQGQR